MEFSDHLVINVALVLWLFFGPFFTLFLGEFKVIVQEFNDSQSFCYFSWVKMKIISILGYV